MVVSPYAESKKAGETISAARSTHFFPAAAHRTKTTAARGSPPRCSKHAKRSDHSHHWHPRLEYFVFRLPAVSLESAGDARFHLSDGNSRISTRVPLAPRNPRLDFCRRENIPRRIR